MKFYSTNKQSPTVSLKDAVLSGLAPDGGLWMPDEIPVMPEQFFQSLSKHTFLELSLEVGKALFANDVPPDVLERIIKESFDFPVPLIKLDDSRYVLELFWGPTMAFKDFAARFMSRLFSYFMQESGRELTILVATSGDTGSAVASGFFGVPGIRVVILYPSGQVSPLQEKQLTSWGKNIMALEVKGSFDDCQKLAKQALVDEDIREKMELGSANSINIARLFPQSFYYFYAYAQLPSLGDSVVVSVPSGNFGNLTAGLLAKRMGLPIYRFISAMNRNDVVLKYLETGSFKPKTSVHTISNAMDVGNPSNFVRILELYGQDLKKIQTDIYGCSFSDQQSRAVIKEVYKKYGYILDPHGAVAFAGLEIYQKENPQAKGILIETAHPGKFAEIVEETLGIPIVMPEQLLAFMNKEKTSTLLANSFAELKSFLLAMN